MKRQKISKIVPEAGSVVDYFPKVMKFILGSKTYYAMPYEYMVDIELAHKLTLYSLAGTQSGDDKLLQQEVIAGINSGLVAIFALVNVPGIRRMTIQIVDPKQAEDTYLHLLVLDDVKEYESNLEYCLNTK